MSTSLSNSHVSNPRQINPLVPAQSALKNLFQQFMVAYLKNQRSSTEDIVDRRLKAQNPTYITEIHISSAITFLHNVRITVIGQT